MLVRSSRFPGLRVAEVGVKFEDGVAEVTDLVALATLRRLAEFGIEVPDDVKPARKKKSD